MITLLPLVLFFISSLFVVDQENRNMASSSSKNQSDDGLALSLAVLPSSDIMKEKRDDVADQQVVKNPASQSCVEKETMKKLAKLKRWEIAKGLSPENWLTLSSDPQHHQQNMLMNIKKGTMQQQQHDDDWLTLSLAPYNDRKLKAPLKRSIESTADNFGGQVFKKSKIMREEETQVAVVACPNIMNQEPGSIFLLKKKVTQSDTSLEQHRLQLSQSDINRSTRPLQELAELAFDREKAGVDVEVVDRKGKNVHHLKFKYVPSLKTYRFMGKDYTQFLVQSKLQENQTLEIFGLPRGSNGEHRLAFINH